MYHMITNLQKVITYVIGVIEYGLMKTPGQ